MNFYELTIEKLSICIINKISISKLFLQIKNQFVKNLFLYYYLYMK